MGEDFEAPGPGHRSTGPTPGAPMCRQYEMDRGRVASAGALLQLVISDPWFAWLHQISEIIVRIDEMTVGDSASTEPEARALIEQIDKLLVPSETGDTFARRYFESIQRQPAVILAHGDVKRVLKAASA